MEKTLSLEASATPVIVDCPPQCGEVVKETSDASNSPVMGAVMTTRVDASGAGQHIAPPVQNISDGNAFRCMWRVCIAAAGLMCVLSAIIATVTMHNALTYDYGYDGGEIEAAVAFYLFLFSWIESVLSLIVLAALFRQSYANVHDALICVCVLIVVLIPLGVYSFALPFLCSDFDRHVVPPPAASMFAGFRLCALLCLLCLLVAHACVCASNKHV